ncbi:hypothetical protein Dimus_007518, partial [Dionaea muscipula]
THWPNIITTASARNLLASAWRWPRSAAYRFTARRSVGHVMELPGSLVARPSSAARRFAGRLDAAWAAAVREEYGRVDAA